jgi:hypothetical protein
LKWIFLRQPDHCDNNLNMAKKLSVEDMKAGRIYRCKHCDAKCDDTFFIGTYKFDDVYLGRLDDTKKRFAYFCNKACSNYVYIQDVTKLMTEENRRHRLIIDDSIQAYRKNIKQDPEGSKYFIELIKMHKAIIRFNDAWLAHKSEYELHELRLKATKHIGDFIEENHDCTIVMNLILKLKKCLDDTNIKLFG